MITQTCGTGTAFYEGYQGVSVTSAATAVFSVEWSGAKGTSTRQSGCLHAQGMAYVWVSGTNPVQWSPDGVSWGYDLPAGFTGYVPFFGNPMWKSTAGSVASVGGMATGKSF